MPRYVDPDAAPLTVVPEGGHRHCSFAECGAHPGPLAGPELSESPLTVPQAARRLGVSRQNVRRVANDLVALAHAVYLPNPDHRSSPLLSLTPQGHEVLADVTAREAQVHRKLFGALPEEESRRSRTLLRQLLADLDRREGVRGVR